MRKLLKTLKKGTTSKNGSFITRSENIRFYNYVGGKADKSLNIFQENGDVFLENGIFSKSLGNTMCATKNGDTISNILVEQTVDDFTRGKSDAIYAVADQKNYDGDVLIEDVKDVAVAFCFYTRDKGRIIIDAHLICSTVKGLGTELINLLKKKVSCGGLIRVHSVSSAVGFYKKMGFQTLYRDGNTTIMILNV